MEKSKQVAYLSVTNALIKRGNTFAATNGEQTVCDTKRGVAPLLALWERGKRLQGFVVSDKVVGAAAAYLYALLCPSFVHAGVVSEKAIVVLNRYGLAYEAEQVVPAIRNRAGDGYCPMEQAVEGVHSAQEALQAVVAKRAELAK